MGAINIQKFIGEAPKLSAELLPATAAQIASNVKLYSGDLLPYNQSSLQTTLAKTGPIKTIYPMDDGAGGFKWLHWATDVDVVRAPVPNNATTQRVYYTGDSEPRITTKALATTGAGTAYPYAYYTLGLPAPLTAPVVTATAFTPITATSSIRTVGTLVTVTTPSAHGLNTGAYVTMSGATVDTSFNVTNAQITVLSTTSFTYFSSGANGTASPAQTINLAGLNLSRTYVYTWVTAWGEESAPAPVSNAVFMFEGAQATVSSLPSTFPTTGAYAGNVYQTASASVAVTGVANNGSGLCRVTAVAHGWNTLDPVTIAGVGGATAANGNWLITVIDADHFDLVGSTFSAAYTSGGTAVRTITLNIYRTLSSTSGTQYFMAGQVPLGTTSFVDSTPAAALVTSLPSSSWFPPPSTMQGIRAIHNNMLMGFNGTTVCFSEPGQPHSWPVKYYQEIGRTIVGLGTVGTTVVVLTDSNPWVIQGNTPGVMQKTRLDTNMPCTSKRGIVNMDWGMCYPTRGGIAVFSLYQGASLATNFVFDWDNFRTNVDPTTITATRYNNKYMASHSKGVFIFEKDEHTGGYLTETSQSFSACYYNTTTAQLYFAFGAPSTLYLWDDPTQGYINFEWKSKVMRVQNYMNLGAARVIANFDVGAGSAASTAALTKNLRLISDHQVGGTFAGNGDRFGPSLTGTQNDIGGSLAGVPLAGSRLRPMPADSATLTFYFYVNGALALTAPILNDTPFRLPTGYRCDKFEVRVTGNALVKSIQLAETMQGLKAL